MRADNSIIHGLWIGKKLSPIELLTLHTFTGFGHQFYLWVYEDLQNEIPDGVILKNANVIMHESTIFRKKENDPKWGIGKGSLGTFSDIFRYKLLYEYGGWWVDMDVSCLKPIDIESSYYFRGHPILPMVGNIMKTPKGCPAMKAAYEIAHEECDENVKEWLRTNQILSEQVHYHDLQKYINTTHSNRDWWYEVEAFLYSKASLPEEWIFLHWMNEEWRRKGLDKYNLYKNATIAEMMLKHSIPIGLKSFEPNLFRWMIRSAKEKAIKGFKKTTIYPYYKSVKSSLIKEN